MNTKTTLAISATIILGLTGLAQAARTPGAQRSHQKTPAKALNGFSLRRGFLDEKAGAGGLGMLFPSGQLTRRGLTGSLPGPEFHLERRLSCRQRFRKRPQVTHRENERPPGYAHQGDYAYGDWNSNRAWGGGFKNWF